MAADELAIVMIGGVGAAEIVERTVARTIEILSEQGFNTDLIDQVALRAAAAEELRRCIGAGFMLTAPSTN